jgi:Outer membrane lipoprotein-sorting protein
MPHLRILVLALVLPLAALAASPARAANLPAPGSPEFARALLQRVDDLYRGEQSHGVMEMEAKTRHWTRAMSLEAWTQGKDYSLVRILEPKKDRGTATLKDKHDLFTYLNNTGRTVKISGAMMAGSWMGSHFTNDDLVRETRLSDDFDITQLPDDKLDGTPVYRFVLVPRPGRPIVWGKIEVAVRIADQLPVKQTYFDEDKKPVRALTLSDSKVVGGRTIPTVMVMQPLDGSGEYTRVTWKELRFDVKLAPGFFSVRNLTSR